MNVNLMSAAAVMGCLSLPAFAQTPAPPAPRACLAFGEVYSWKARDNRTLIVEDNWRHKFKVSLLSYCPSLQFKERVGFRSPAAMRLTCLSAGDDVIVRNFGTGFQRCPIKSIETHTPAMQKADEAAAAQQH